MGGCISKVLPEAQASVRPHGPKRFDIFIAHHEGVDDDGSTDNFSSQFADWVEELCIGLGLKVLYDKTNLSRILDENRLRVDVPASRAAIAIVSKDALRDQNGMQQELWWAHSAKIPIIPFYDGDKYSTQTYASWQKKYGFALQRPPVIYRRRAHMKAKDALIVAMHDALQESFKGHLPEKLLQRMAKQENRQRRRDRRAERRKDGLEITVPSSYLDSGRALQPRDDINKWSLPPLDDLPEVATGYGLESPATAMQNQTESKGDKQFRFRDDAYLGKQEDGPKGVKKLLKTLQDPFGEAEKDLRTAILQQRGDEDGEDKRYVPKHREIRPLKSCLKKGTESGPRPAVPVPAASTNLDPRLQKGVARLMEYLQAVTSEDAGQLPTVLRVLELAVPNEEVACRAFAIIFEFIQGSAQCRKLVVQQKGIPHFVMGMTTHTQSLDLQTYACGILYALSCFRPENPEKDNNSAAIAHAGGIGRLVDAMQTFPTCLEIQQFAIGAIRHLAVEMQGNNRRQLSDGGEVQLTMRGINKRMIAKTGGIEMIAKAMQKFPHDYEIQENGCAALSNLTTTSPDTKIRAARAGCIRAVVSTMRSFLHEPELQQMACNVLRSLASGVPENKIAIVAQGGIRQLCQALANHRGDPDVLVQAVAALTNLTSQLPENKQAICTGGGLELTVAALRAHPAHSEMQQQGLGLLYNIAYDKDLRSQVADTAASQVIEAACVHSDKSVQKLAKLLQRQLKGEIEPAADTTAGKSDVDGLFAARRPGQKPGMARSKALTKVQKRVMAEIRQESSGWLSGDSSGTSRASSRVSASEQRRAAQSQASSEASSGGRWDMKRRENAAEFGIQDLEGLSDAEDDAPNQWDYVVRRGIARQTEATTPKKNSNQSNESLFGVARAGSSRKKKKPVFSETPGYDNERGLPAHQHVPKQLPGEQLLQGQGTVLPIRSQDGGFLYPWEMPLQNGGFETNLPLDRAEEKTADLDRPSEAPDHDRQDEPGNLDAISVVSSEPSEGGMIDLFDDAAKNRIMKRVKREKRKSTHPDDANGEGAALYEEMLFEVELEDNPHAQNLLVKPKRTKEQKKFMKALKKIGESAPEKDTGEWKEVLRLQFEANKSSSVLLDSASAASVVLDGLDGLARVVRQRREAAMGGVRNAAAGMGNLAQRVKSEGLVHVLQTSKLARRLAYGLDDDEESIYDLDELGQLGDAEVALLDALGSTTEFADDEDGPRVASQKEPAPAAPPEEINEKLQAASRRLAQSRQERRLVKLL